MYPKKRSGQHTYDGTTRAGIGNEEAMVHINVAAAAAAAEASRHSPSSLSSLSSGQKRTTASSSPTKASDEPVEEGTDPSEQQAAAASCLHHRMKLRSGDAPPSGGAGAPRISYAEDLRRSDVDEDDEDDQDEEDEEEDYDQNNNHVYDHADDDDDDDAKHPAARGHNRRYGGGGAHAHQYNGHRFGRRGDPRMARALQLKLDHPDMDVTLALIRGGYRYDHGAGDKAVDRDGIKLGQRRNQLARRVRNEWRKADGGRAAASYRPQLRPAAASRKSSGRKKATKRKKTARAAGGEGRRSRGRPSKAARLTNRSVSISPPPSSTSRTPTPPLPSMSFASNLDDPYEFARMDSAGEREYPPLPPLPGGYAEGQQQQLGQMQETVDSPYISDISDIEQDCGRDGKTTCRAAAAAAAAAAPVDPFPTYQGAPLIPSLPVSRSMSFATPPPKEIDNTESVMGENLLEEDMLGLTKEEKREAHDDVHGFRRLDSSLMQTVMSKFLCLKKDSARTSVRENQAIGKSAESLMSPAVHDLVRQMKVEIEARPAEERDAMLKAFVRCSPAERQVEFGDKRLELFLRREHMDPVVAAARFVRYWQKRRELFGSEKYGLPLTIDGALRDDHVALEVGHWIILPKPDAFGRTVMLWLKRGPYDFDSMSRALFYIAEQAALLPSSRKGIVWLSADLNTTIWKYDRRLDQVVIDFEEEYLPFEISAIHVCSVQGYLWRLLKPVILACFSRRTRERLRLHLSTDGDIADILQGYGIERSALPSIMGGEIDVDEAYGRWLKDRGLAQWHIYSCANE